MSVAWGLQKENEDEDENDCQTWACRVYQMG